MFMHTNPTRKGGFRERSLADASGWYGPSATDLNIALVFRPLSRKHFRGRAGHEDRGGRVGPLEFEIAAGKVGQDAAIGSAVEDARDADCTGTRSAGEGDSR